MFGVMATNPMSLIGELIPENTSLTAPDTAPDEPSYGCGLSGPGEGPTVIGPSVAVFVAAMKPCPARLQPSPFMSMNDPVAPAVVGCACRTSRHTGSSPSAYVERFAQVPAELGPPVQGAGRSGVVRCVGAPL